MVKIQQKRIDAHVHSIDMDSEIEQAINNHDKYMDNIKNQDKYRENTKNKVHDLLDN